MPSGSGNSDAFQTNITVVGGVAYDITGNFCHSSTEDAISSSVLSMRMFMHIEWFDSSITSIANSFSANHNGTFTANVWSQIVMTVVAPSNAVLATLHVETDSDIGGGSIFGDDFYFATNNQVPLIPTGLMLIIR